MGIHTAVLSNPFLFTEHYQPSGASLKGKTPIGVCDQSQARELTLGIHRSVSSSLNIYQEQLSANSVQNLEGKLSQILGSQGSRSWRRLHFCVFSAEPPVRVPQKEKTWPCSQQVGPLAGEVSIVRGTCGS